jgi:DNA-binding FadR family transcriptional regulator
MAKVSAIHPSRAHLAAEFLAALARRATPGDKLGSKSELREQVGVSVGTFNEAIRLLQARRVVTMRPGPSGGVFAAAESGMIRLGNAVLSLDSTDPDMVVIAVRIRDALEPLILEDAIAYSDRSRLAKMQDELAGMHRAADASDPAAFIHANWALHRAIAEASPSELLREMYVGLIQTVEAHTISVLPAEPAPVAEVIAARCAVHDDLIAAIASGSLDDGLDALRRHRE